MQRCTDSAAGVSAMKLVNPGEQGLASQGGLVGGGASARGLWGRRSHPSPFFHEKKTLKSCDQQLVIAVEGTGEEHGGVFYTIGCSCESRRSSAGAAQRSPPFISLSRPSIAEFSMASRCALSFCSVFAARLWTPGTGILPRPCRPFPQHLQERVLLGREPGQTKEKLLDEIKTILGEKSSQSAVLHFQDKPSPTTTSNQLQPVTSSVIRRSAVLLCGCFCTTC